MTKAQEGSQVDVHYTGSLDDGSVFDSSREGDPLSFVLGDGRLIKGFDDAVIGMQEGESKTVNIPAEEAYGPYREDMVVKVGRADIPEEVQLGNVLQSNIQGREVYFTVIDMGPDSVTLDANHPLAGKNLNFEITLIKVA